MRRAYSLALLALSACSDQPRSGAAAHSITPPNDSAFAEIQARGHAAMGVDQYTSMHHFEPLPDGGRISLERDLPDSAGVAQIRAHMIQIAAAFGRGDFGLPGFVHDRNVPGTMIMRARRSHIDYRPDTLPRGAALRIRSNDPIAVAAIHEFLVFQRQDHRAPHGPGTH
jgi:hypothetical protein